MRRKADDDRAFYRTKNESMKTEIEELIKENKKLSSERASTGERLTSLRMLNK